MTKPARPEVSALRTLLVLVALAAVGMRIERALAAIRERQAECRRLAKISRRRARWPFVPALRCPRAPPSPGCAGLGDQSYVLVAEPLGGFDAETVSRIGRVLPEAEISWRCQPAEPAEAPADDAVDSWSSGLGPGLIACQAHASERFPLASCTGRATG